MRISDVWRCLAGGMIKPLEVLVFQVSRVGEVNGIIVCDLTTADSSNSAFLQPTKEALDLIRGYDPKRYLRVMHYIKYIVNRPLITAGNFQWVRNVCNVDYNRRFTTDFGEWNVRMYACLLVHEATHGLLRARRLPYDDANWERIERLCCLEEYRFIRRVDEWWADEYRSPKRFDPELWRRHRDAAVRKISWRKRWQEYREERLKQKREEKRKKHYELLRKKGRRLF